MNASFAKSTWGLHFILLLSMLANIQDNLRKINISFIKCLNFEAKNIKHVIQRCDLNINPIRSY